MSLFRMEAASCIIVSLLCAVKVSSVTILQTNATCPGQTLTLICVNGSTDGIVWKINGEIVGKYLPGYQKDTCKSTLTFPNGVTGQYCGTPGNVLGSNISFVASLDQSNWNVTCMGSDTQLNDTAMISIAQRAPLVPMEMTLSCSNRTLSWVKPPGDYVDNYTIQTGKATFITRSQTFEFVDDQLEGAPTLSVWASNCHGNGLALTKSFDECIRDQSFPKKCEGFWRSKVICTVWSSLSFISLVVCAAALPSHWNSHKRRPSLDKKLTTWLTVTEMILLVVNALQMIIYLTDSHNTVYCSILGGFYQLALVLIAAATFLIDCYLGAVVCRKKESFEKLLKPLLVTLLTVYVAISLSPWSLYGDSGAWCWISIRDKNSCTTRFEGIITQLLVWYAEILLQLVAGIILLYKVPPAQLDSECVALLKAYFWSFTVANLCGLVNRAAAYGNGGNPVEGLQLLQVITFTLWPIVAVLPIILNGGPIRIVFELLKGLKIVLWSIVGVFSISQRQANRERQT